MFFCQSWLRGVDLNHRPLGYEPNELPDCSTPRHRLLLLKGARLSSADDSRVKVPQNPRMVSDISLEPPFSADLESVASKEACADLTDFRPLGPAWSPP
jgi:hypothetical protein